MFIPTKIRDFILQIADVLLGLKAIKLSSPLNYKVSDNCHYISDPLLSEYVPPIFFIGADDNLVSKF